MESTPACTAGLRRIGCESVGQWTDPDYSLTMKNFEVYKNPVDKNFFFSTDLIVGNPSLTVDGPYEVRASLPRGITPLVPPPVSALKLSEYNTLRITYARLVPKTCPCKHRHGMTHKLKPSSIVISRYLRRICAAGTLWTVSETYMCN
eukprot:1182541-Prorocentrum_minimum.AAC.1